MAKQRRRKRSQKKRQVTLPSQRRQPWLMGLILLLMAAGILIWSPWSQPGSVPPGAIIAADQSVPAPPFTLANTTGEQIKLADYLGQQPVVLAFYMGDF
jgi:hypothetical protein